MALFNPFSFLDQFAQKAVDIGKKVVSEVKESAQAAPFSQSLVGKGISTLGGFASEQTKNLGGVIGSRFQDTLGGQKVVSPPGVFTGEVIPRSRVITPTNFSAIPAQSPQFSPAGGFGSTYTDPVSGATFYYGQNGWQQISGYGPSMPSVSPPVSIPTSPIQPPIQTPAPLPPVFRPLYNPETTMVDRFGNLLTGLGGFSGASAFQFGSGVGIQGAVGGAQALPSGLAGTSRFAGGLPYLPDEEEKKRRTQNIQGYTVQPGDTVNKIANRLGIDPSQISGFSSGNPNLIRPGETLNIQGDQPVGGPTTPLVGVGFGGQVAPSPRFESTFGKPGLGISPMEGAGIPPGIIPQPGGGVRTFNRIGQNIYETTGGQLNYVPPQQWAISGLSGMTLGQLRELQPQDLNDAQKQMVNRIATQQGQPEPFPRAKVEVPPVTGADFTEQKITDQDTTTKTQYNEYSSTQLNYRKDKGQVNPNTLTQDLPSNGYNQYYKNINDQTGEWEIFTLDGRKVGEPFASQMGLNIADLNTAEGILSLGKGELNLESILGFDPNKQIVSKDSELQKRADELAELMKTMINRDPWSGQTVTQVRDSLNKELNLNSLYDERLENIKQMNEVKNSFDVLRGEIEDDPDFSKKSKVLRTDFLTNKTQRLLDTYVRERELIDLRITQAEKTVTTRMGDMVTQYNIYRNQVNDIQNAYTNLQTRIDRVSENAQQSLQFLAANPEAMKGATRAQLQQEIQFISNNGYLPMSMIIRLGQNVGKKTQGILQDKTTGDWYAYTNNPADGLSYVGSTTPQPEDTGLSPTDQVTLSSFILRTNVAIASISNDPNLNYAQKATQISSLIGELQAKYANNKTALGIIRDNFPSASTTGAGLAGTVTELTQAGFEKDLANELATVRGQAVWSRKGAAQRAQDRLLGKYKGKSTEVKTAFSQWVK